MITLRADKGIFGQMRVRILAGFVLAISCAVSLVTVSDRPAAAHAAPDGFADLAQTLLPAVVNISSTLPAPRATRRKCPNSRPDRRSSSSSTTS
jgi:hypothetical protein